ncbi:MAG: type II toxin-antitoxin system HigB family toxin [Elusimicrobia bacterium]|jgi:mRNA interferase HigB|nr:type II toxin-antitoxin system HigB family toxin [Elusimicrobiota bacterium]
MRIITRKRLIEFSKRHPDARHGLTHWYRVMTHTDYASRAALRVTFPSADAVDPLTVFNIAGNEVRLIVAIHYNRKIVYIRHVLTHAEYDKDKWKE